MKYMSKFQTFMEKGFAAWSVKFVSCNSCPGFPHISVRFEVLVVFWIFLDYLFFGIFGGWFTGSLAWGTSWKAGPAMIWSAKATWTWNVLQHPGTTRSHACWNLITEPKHHHPSNKSITLSLSFEQSKKLSASDGSGMSTSSSLQPIPQGKFHTIDGPKPGTLQLGAPTNRFAASHFLFLCPGKLPVIHLHLAQRHGIESKWAVCRKRIA